MTHEDCQSSVVAEKVQGIKEDSRVKRRDCYGSVGTVRMIRQETRPSKLDSVAKSLLVQVQWDNGTLSYVSMDSLEAVPG